MAAIEADRVVIALIGDTKQLDGPVNNSARQFERNMSTIEHSANRAERSIVRTSGQSANAIRNLSFQVADVGTQLGSGASPFIVIAQQGPQVVQALEDMKASGASLGQVMRGIALPGFLAVLSVLAPLVSNLLQGADAADTKRKAVDELTKAIRDMAAASAAAISSGQREIYIARAQADAYLAAAAAKREEIKAKLADRIENLSAARVTEGFGQLAIPGRGAGSIEAQIGDLRRQLAAQDGLVRTAEQNVRRTQARISQQLVTEALDPIAKATGQYERQVDKLARQVAAGTITDAQYRQSLAQTTLARDRAVAAAQRQEGASRRNTGASRAETESSRARTTALRAEIAAEKEFASLLRELEARYDPASAAARNYREELEKIAKAGASLNPDQQAEYIRRATENFIKARADAFTLDSVEQMRPAYSEDRDRERKAIDDAARAQKDAEDELQRVRERNISDLAYLYESLFVGGATSLWDSFKREGLRAIATLAAEWTAKQLGLGVAGAAAGGGIGGIITGLIGGLFGRASGGHVAPRSLHPVNEHAGGVELLRMGPQGGEVIPLGQARAAPANRGVTVNQYFTLDARQGIMTPQLLQGVNALVDQKAGQARDQAVAISRGVIPQDMQKAQRYAG
jgi:hypothetical protein